jgi:Holliday junction resolvase
VSGYAQGVRVEHHVVHHLTANGYDCQRAASSKGVADVVAFKAGQVLLVNVKRTSMPPPAERVELLRVAACLPGVAVPLVARKPAGMPLSFRRLTGPGPKDWQEWDADEAATEQGDVIGDHRDPWPAA